MGRRSPVWRKATTLSEIVTLLGPSRRGTIITPSGERRRVLIEADGSLFVLTPGLRRWGTRYLSLPPGWQGGVLVRPVPGEAQRLAQALLAAARAVARHTPPDVWPELAREARTVLAHAPVFLQAADIAAIDDLCRQLGLADLRPGTRITTLRTQGAPERARTEALEAFHKRAPFSLAWRGKYDCTAWGEPCPDGYYRACLATKYRGMGNGHYWALLDGVHALYLESD